MRQLLLFVVGAVTGVLVFRWLRRKLQQVAAQATPDAIVSRVAKQAQNIGGEVADFIDEVRVNTRRRESELRAEIGMAPILPAEDSAQPPPAARRI